MPKLAVLLVVCAFGYLYVESLWWIVIFVFGALGLITNQLFVQRTEALRERLQNR